MVSHGHPEDFTGSDASAPGLSVVADGGAEASHLVLPVVEGTLGGSPPTMAYPPRPFLPRGS